MRIGQRYACVVIEFFNLNTYNTATIRTSTKRALLSIGAYLNADLLNKLYSITSEEKDNDNDDDDADVVINPSKLYSFILIDSKLMHKTSPYFPIDYLED